MSSHLLTFPAALRAGARRLPAIIIAIARSSFARDAIAFAVVALFILVFLFWSAIAADQLTYGRIQ